MTISERSQKSIAKEPNMREGNNYYSEERGIAVSCNRQGKLEVGPGG